MEVEPGYGDHGDCAWCLFPHEGEHRAVVPRVDVHVEHVAAGRGGDGRDDLGPPALADVDYALEHVDALAPPRRDYAGVVDIGAPELIIILLIILLIFGGAKLPKLARSLGQAQKEFKQGIAEGGKTDEDEKEKPTA
jgi:sec-independent protein translocase protein TatA